VSASGKLHTECFGAGIDVFMVHGWGMHGGVWRDFAENLADRFRVTLVDLPGHGRSREQKFVSLEGVVEQLLAVAPPKAHWLGWSLGASIALQTAASHPERIGSLCLMAGNARFTRDENWPWAMDGKLLDQFAADMMTNYQQTLQRFLALQTAGLDDSRALLKRLRERIAECPSPEESALRTGLNILHDADLRSGLCAIAAPLLVIMGGKDRLVPAQSGHAMMQLAPKAHLRILENAGHVPFLTQPDECDLALEEFWSRHEPAR
jgi:pimeloyl-[acyl-carrier protein] methyl ester esterase